MCGIYGVIGKRNVAAEVSRGIRLLKHRGQEAAGILLIDDVTDQHTLHKAIGPIEHLLSVVKESRKSPDGTLGVAQVRYATNPGDTILEAQPFWTDEGNIGFAQNGQTINIKALRRVLERDGKRMQSGSDGELVLRTFARRYHQSEEETLQDRIEHAVRMTRRDVVGSYALILPIKGEGLLGFRDPHGIRPLSYGMKKGFVAFASESSALKHNGYHDIQDVQADELIFVDTRLRVHKRTLPKRHSAHCGFEYFYFADPDSVIDGVSVNHARYRMGRLLAHRIPAKVLSDIDVVVPIPQSALPAADGFCDETDLDLRNLIRKYPLGRIFITPDQEEREFAASQLFRYATSGKRNPFYNQSVLLMEDSIVRGTNMRSIVKSIFKLGARAVHLAITWPIIDHACPYGVDMEREGQNLLIGRDKTVAQIRRSVGATSLTYATPADVNTVLGGRGYCKGCATGEYPTRTSELVQLR